MYNVYENQTQRLLADPLGADLVAVALAGGSGEVKRGTVLVRKANVWAPAAAEEAAGTAMLAVLDEDAVAGEAAVTVRAWRGGRLVKGQVALKDGAALTEEAELALRQQGIVLDPMIGEAQDG